MTMKKSSILWDKFIVLSCTVLMLFFGYQEKGKSAESLATATIAVGITETKDTQTPTGGDLAFGTIIPGSSTGTVTIVPSTAARSYSGSVQLVSSISGPAAFTVSGTPNSSYSVTLPENDRITISNGSDTMEVNSFSISRSSGSSTLGNDGLASFRVGGKLEVEANQPPGNYTGTFAVTVAYQ
jgi:spore coat protein U-like protein